MCRRWMSAALVGLLLLCGPKMGATQEGEPVYLSLSDNTAVYESISDIESPSEPWVEEPIDADTEARFDVAQGTQELRSTLVQAGENEIPVDATDLPLTQPTPPVMDAAVSGLSTDAAMLPPGMSDIGGMTGGDDFCATSPTYGNCATACGLPCGGRCPTCCGAGTHRTFFIGELLYLRARNAEVAYAVPADGPVGPGQPVPIQVGQLGVLDPEYDAGFRVGLNVALDTVSSLELRFSLFESRIEDSIAAAPTDILRSLVTHPSTLTAADDALTGSGSLDIDFETVDFAYRQLALCRELAAVNYVVGARYGRLEQHFAAQFEKNGTEFVASDVDFEGGGLRIGLEASRHSCRNQLHVYTNGYANFLAGRFRNSYFQGDDFDQEVVNVVWESSRIVPIVDFECGVGWTSCDGCLRLTTGYLVSSWFNAVTARDAIAGVQRNDYTDLTEAITFDGLRAAIEYRF